MALFIDFMNVMGLSPEQAAENLYELKNNYQFWHADVSIFTPLEELRRKAVEATNLMSPPLSSTTWRSVIKKLSDTRNLCESNKNNLLNSQYNATPRKGVTGMPLIFQPVRQTLNKQLRRKREIFTKLIDYHFMLQGKLPGVKMFALALFLDWSSTESRRKAGKPEDHYRCHLTIQMESVSTLLNGLRHHRSLTRLVGYFWVTMQDARNKPYVRLHLYVPEENYTEEMLLSIILRWLKVTGEYGGASHKHSDLLKKHHYRLDEKLTPFTIEEDMLQINHFGKKLSMAPGPAPLTMECYLESLAKRVMFWPGSKPYFFSNATTP